VKEGEVRFEKALGELKAIVDKLEKGDLELDESLKMFERGVKLMAVCSKKLDDAQRRVEIVLKESGGRKAVREFSEGAVDPDLREALSEESGGEEKEDGEDEK